MATFSARPLQTGLLGRGITGRTRQPVGTSWFSVSPLFLPLVPRSLPTRKAGRIIQSGRRLRPKNAFAGPVAWPSKNTSSGCPSNVSPPVTAMTFASAGEPAGRSAKKSLCRVRLENALARQTWVLTNGFHIDPCLFIKCRPGSAMNPFYGSLAETERVRVIRPISIEKARSAPSSDIRL